MNEQTVKIVDIKKLTSRIKSFRLVSANGKKLAPFSPGSHVAVEITLEKKVRRNSYSLCSSPYETDFYEIAVLLAEKSRGGSQYLHQISVGTELNIGFPKNSFTLASLARKHILIAGGIGITPLLSMLTTLSRYQTTFELHYTAKSQTECAFYEFLKQKYGSQVTFYFSEKDERLSSNKILKEQPLGTHIYLCAPHSLSDNFYAEARALGYPDLAIHREIFGAAKTNNKKPFTVVLSQSGKEITVPKDKTLLAALETAGFPVNYSCRVGGCGACELGVLAGEIHHLDSYYSPEERAKQNCILSCTSRAKSKQLIIDL